MGISLGQLGGRFGALRVAQHEVHHVGAFGHEVVAVGQLSYHDGIEVGHVVGALLALQGDAELAGEGLRDVGQARRPRQLGLALVVQRHLLRGQLVGLSGLVARALVHHLIDDFLYGAHLVGHGDVDVWQGDGVVRHLVLHVAVLVHLVGIQVIDIRLPRPVDGIAHLVERVAPLLVQVIDFDGRLAVL